MQAIVEPKRPTAVFRFDASPEIGGGHAVRCITIAHALNARGWDCILAVRAGTAEIVEDLAGAEARWLELECGTDFEADEIATRLSADCDLLIVDHYGRDAVFEEACREWAKKILVIDDLADRPHACDLLLDQTAGRQAEDYEPLVPADCRLLLGSGYALLKPRFADLREPTLRRRREQPGLRRLLVSVGLMDHANLTETALKGIELAGLDVSVDVVLGGHAPHLEAVRSAAERLGSSVTVTTNAGDMPERSARADLAIGAAGTTSWERCCLGLPGVVAICADNQNKIAEVLVAAGAVDLLGRDVSITPGMIADAIVRLQKEDGRLAEMSAGAADLCDGLGARRLMEVLEG